MCGIYGIIGDAGPNKLELARALCVLNAVRGDHSAGLAITTATMRDEIFRRPMKPGKFARKGRFRDMASSDYRVLIGHTRFATHGTICEANAHPFKHGTTVGVHNGVVTNVTGMGKYLGKTFNVDSQYLIESLDSTGGIGPAMGSINILYFGRKDVADLRIIRDGNPLWYADINGRRAVVLTSEKRHLEAALVICGMRGKAMEVPDESAYSLCIRKNGIHAERFDIPRMTDDEIEAKSYGPTESEEYSGFSCPYYYDDKIAYTYDQETGKATPRINEITDRQWRDAEMTSVDRDRLDEIEFDLHTACEMGDFDKASALESEIDRIYREEEERASMLTTLFMGS